MFRVPVAEGCADYVSGQSLKRPRSGEEWHGIKREGSERWSGRARIDLSME